MNLRLKTTFFTVISLIFFQINSSFAGFSLIRDSETEKFLRELCRPVLVSAGLSPKDISIYIVNDPSLNAFVTGGQNIFIHTGLIRKYKTPDALIGVVAHEAGHIVAGHIARSSEEIKKAGNTILLSYLLAVGAAIAGAPGAAQGILLGGNNIAEKLYLKYSRTQEEAADRHALKYLEKIDYPADGLVELLEFFELSTRGYKGAINEYAQSHPISRKRIDYLKNNVNYKGSNKKINSKLQPLMNRVLVKLEAFIDTPNRVLSKYKNDNSENARYAKSIAYYHQGQIQTSINMLDKIIKDNENDGFLYELKGQILYESGDITNSILSYKKAIKLLDNQDSSQARIAFSNAILSLKESDKTLSKLAIKNLKIAYEFEKYSPSLLKNLAKAYNNIDDKARSLANLAEYNFLIGDNKKAKKYASQAKKEFKKIKDKSSVKTDLLRLEDLIELINFKDKDSK